MLHYSRKISLHIASHNLNRNYMRLYKSETLQLCIYVCKLTFNCINTIFIVFCKPLLIKNVFFSQTSSILCNIYSSFFLKQNIFSVGDTILATTNPIDATLQKLILVNSAFLALLALFVQLLPISQNLFSSKYGAKWQIALL